MGKGRLTNAADDCQAETEGGLYAVGIALLLLEQDMLRVRQAIRRSGLDDLLGPVLVDYVKIHERMCILQEVLRVQFEAGQAGKWRKT